MGFCETEQSSSYLWTPSSQGIIVSLGREVIAELEVSTTNNREQWLESYILQGVHVQQIIAEKAW